MNKALKNLLSISAFIFYSGAYADSYIIVTKKDLLPVQFFRVRAPEGLRDTREKNIFPNAFQLYEFTETKIGQQIIKHALDYGERGENIPPWKRYKYAETNKATDTQMKYYRFRWLIDSKYDFIYAAAKSNSNPVFYKTKKLVNYDKNNQNAPLKFPDDFRRMSAQEINRDFSR